MAEVQSSVIWRPIEGFPGYRVGSDGSVGSRMRGPWRKLRWRVTQDGHCRVALRRNRKAHDKYVHVLVLEAFIGTRPTGMECCHNDGNAKNNDLTNLRWDTPQANAEDKIRHGTVPKGEGHFKAKLTEVDVKLMRKMSAGGYTNTELAKIFNTAQPNVCNIVNRKAWRHVA